VPVLFAGLLNHYGQLGPAEIASKRRFTYRFALWRARALHVPMRFPPAHPFNPLKALRLILAAGCDRRAIETVFDAAWAEGRDVADDAVIAALARDLGVSNVEQASNREEVKNRLRDNTAWAVEQGVFGVPTLLIYREMFWGQDAFDMALDYLRDRAPFLDAEMQRLDSLPAGAARPRK
jgi:2-hydroxychromene-2-carboxylate isomerase